MFLCCSRRATALPPTATAPFPATVRSGCQEMLRVKQCLLREYKSIHKQVVRMLALRNCHFLQGPKVLPVQPAKHYSTLCRRWWMAVGKSAHKNIKDFLPSTNDRKYFRHRTLCCRRQVGNKNPSHTPEAHVSHIRVLRFVRNVSSCQV